MMFFDVSEFAINTTIWLFNALMVLGIVHLTMLLMHKWVNLIFNK